MLVNLLYKRWLGDIFLKSMADLIQVHSIFSLSYCNQHVLRTDTNVRKQLTFRESSCFLDIFTHSRESLETFPFRSSLFYILRSCYNQLLACQKLYTLTRVTLESHVFAWELLFRKINDEQRLSKTSKIHRIAFVSKKLISLLKNWPCKMKGRLGVSHLSPFVSSFRSRIHRELARREPRRKTADLYFFVRRAAGRPVCLCMGQEPSAFLILGVPRIDPQASMLVYFNVIVCAK